MATTLIGIVAALGTVFGGAGSHWNGSHWNGSHWNGSHWNGSHWNQVRTQRRTLTVKVLG